MKWYKSRKNKHRVQHLWVSGRDEKKMDAALLFPFSRQYQTSAVTLKCVSQFCYHNAWWGSMAGVEELWWGDKLNFLRPVWPLPPKEEQSNSDANRALTEDVRSQWEDHSAISFFFPPSWPWDRLSRTN